MDQYVGTLEARQGVRIACVGEIALRMGHIGNDDCYRPGVRLGPSEYGAYARAIAPEPAGA